DDRAGVAVVAALDRRLAHLRADRGRLLGRCEGLAAGAALGAARAVRCGDGEGAALLAARHPLSRGAGPLSRGAGVLRGGGSAAAGGPPRDAGDGDLPVRGGRGPAGTP